MKFGFSTFFFLKKSPLQVIKEGMSVGVRVFEICMELPHVLSMNDEVVKEMESLAGDGLEFSMHAPFFEINLGSFFEDIRAMSKEKIMRALDVAGRIKASPVVIHPGYTFLARKAPAVEERTRANFLADLSELAVRARELGVEIALENVHMPYFLFHDLHEFTAIHEAVPDVGITLDVGHAFIAKSAKGVSDPEWAILSDLADVGVGNLRHVHLHGNTGTRDDHAILESGANLGRIVAGLKRLRYEGRVIVESYDMEKYGMARVVDKLKDMGADLGSI